MLAALVAIHSQGEDEAGREPVVAGLHRASAFPTHRSKEIEQGGFLVS